MDADLIKALPVVLQENAAAHADKIAFEDGCRAVTYRGLEARTRRLAGHLVGLGLARGDRVAIFLRNGVAVVESYLAVVRACGVGVPINPASTSTELRHLLADSGATVVITESARIPDVIDLAGDAVVVASGPVPQSTGAVRWHDFEELADTEPEQTAPDDLGLDEVSWIFYTSGTSGRPKGVLSTQRNCLYSVAASYVPIPGLSEADRVVWPLPLFHSLSHIACVLAVTVVGATARILDSASTEDVLTALLETRATFVAGVPTVYQNLVQMARRQAVRLPDLRIALVGGAVATPQLCRDFRHALAIPLVDAYGSTETCGAITMNPPGGVRVDGSCGLPVPGVEVRIVDPDTGRDVPAGDEGEVWVSGPNVMVGYHNLPEATASALRDGWFHTGDLARRDEAGYFTVCGRISDLIIRGGENVHPEEIERAIRGFAGVTDVAVAGEPHELLGEVPTAYVVLDPDAGLDVRSLIQHCREALSAEKVPEAVYEVASIPRTASGKVRRRELRAQHVLLHYTASRRHDAVLALDWVPAQRNDDWSPRSWVFVGTGAADLVAGWPAGAGAATSQAELAAVGGGGSAPDVAVLLPTPGVGPRSIADCRDDARRLAGNLDTWLSHPDTAATRLLVLTRGAVTIGSEDQRSDVDQTLVQAVVGSLQRRHADRVSLVDLAVTAELDERTLRAALAVTEPRSALRPGGPVVPRLVRHPVAGSPRRLSENTVLVTGADTVRGAAVAEHLTLVHRVPHLVLVGSADARRPEALRNALDGAPAPVTAVLVADGDPEVSALVLATVSDDEPALLLLVVTDPPGDVESAIAHALADAVVAERRRSGRPAALLAWNNPADGADDARRTRDGLSALDALLADPDVPALLSFRAPRPAVDEDVPPMLQDLFPVPAAQARPDAAVAAALREALAGLDEHTQLTRLERLVCAQAAVVAGQPESAPVPADRAFRDLGYTSVAVVELRDRLTASTGLRLPTTVSFDHPTPRALAARLLAELTGRARSPVPPSAAPVDRVDPADPIAIIGMACRLPGGIIGPDDLWRFVLEGREARYPFPDDRGWDLAALFDSDPDHAGTSYADHGGFLQGAGDFDTGFFGISPREALAMDPQQRQLLESSWEGLEHAGLDVAGLRGTDVGVFFGVMEQGYGSSGPLPSELTAFATTGAATSVASGRISYLFGFHGPAVTVNTACSSSLVSLHLAAQALRGGECSVALAGGVTVMATPRSFVEFSRQRALAGDGRCKAYSSSADGTSWAEGVGVLVLERLADARRAGHRVLGVLRGSATNQDGASNGLTAPSGLAQQRVIRRALAAAGLSPADVDAVEGHGTGTVLGDPIEVEALLATYGQHRDSDRPLWLGSLKSNIGHTQAAAGVAGVIKMVQALRHGILPPTLHVSSPTDRVDWTAGAVELLTTSRPWPDLGRPRRAGVSSFGLSGTNAHLILEQAPEQSPQDPGGQVELPGVVPLVLSTASPKALRAQAGRLASRLVDAGESGWVDAARALIAHRTALRERAVLLAGSRDEALSGLAALAEGADSVPHVVRGTINDPDMRRGVVLVFPGQGAQWRGMGRELLDTSAVFAERVGECARLMAEWTDWSLLDVLRGETDDELLRRVDVVQPASFAVMVGLAAVWASLGVTPNAVMGHSQGEVAAAYVAGALSLPDAARLVTLRSRMIADTLAGHGGMASVSLSADAAADRLAAWAGRIEIAAVNGPSAVVLSGDTDALDEVLAVLDREGVRTRRIPVDYASHTGQVEAVRAAMTESLSDLVVRTPTVPFYSSVTGTRVTDGDLLDGDYWYRNLREQVRFGPTIAALVDQGFDAFVEVSAHPVLVHPVAQVVDAAGVDAVVTGSLRREDGGLRRLLTSAAELFVEGAAVDWFGILPRTGGEWVDLPPYAFEHQHYWLRPRGVAGEAGAAGLAEAGHPLLGSLVHLPASGLVATARWRTDTLPRLVAGPADGRVLDAALIEAALRVGDEVGAPVVDELIVDLPVILPPGGARDIRIVVGETDDAGRRSIDVCSRAPDVAPGEDWTRHAWGFLSPAVPASPPSCFDVDVDVALDEDAYSDAQHFGVHPALLDNAVNVVVPEGMRVWRWQGVELRATGACAVRVAAAPAGDGAYRLELADPTRQPVLRAARLDVRPLTAVTHEAASAPDGLFRTAWLPCPVPADAPAPSVRYVATAADVAAADADLLVYEADTTPDDPRAAVGAALAVLQAFATRDDSEPTRLAVVTADDASLSAAAVWGLTRSAQSEQPGRIVLVDTDDVTRPRLAGLVTVLADEPQLRLRGGEVTVPRLTSVGAPPADSPALALDPEGTVLITGGTGTLAAVTARHLVTRYDVRHLILASRRGPAADGAAELRDDLVALGARVHVAALDAADRDQTAALLATIPPEHPLTAVVHAAGVLDDGVLTALSPDRVDAVFRPKLDAARHLDELTRGLPLAAFVLYSSAAGVLGNVGQGNYAAANAALESLAGQRRRGGLPAVSIAWGYWESASGMTRHLGAADRRRNRELGMLGLSDEHGLALFDAALAAGDAALVAARFGLAAPHGAGATIPAVLRGLAPVRRPAARARTGSTRGPLVERIGAISDPAERSRALVALIQQHGAAVLGHANPDAVRPDRTFRDAGFDSLTALELRNRLAAATGCRLSPAVIFDYPRPTALADHLRDKLLGGTAARPAVAPMTRVDEPVAIVSMACRFPAGVRSPEDLWRVLVDEVDAVTEFPDDRGWDVDGIFHPDPDHSGTTYVRHAAFLDDAAGFDAAFFDISPHEALAMDPQQRLLLETSWEAVERAGIDPTMLAGQDVGVFVGVNSHDWTVRTHQAVQVEGFRLTGGSGSVISGRVAYHLGLQGPAITVDTACSSSLTAVHLAIQALRNGDCSMALVGGVMVMGTVETFVEFSRQRGLAPDGRCKAFADAADGTGWSEGVGLLLVEPLSAARRHGHPVLAVIRGSAVNQDGASNGLTAPNGPSQQQVIRRALAAAGLRPDEVDAVEAHGTGTRLGDPIEAHALLETYGQGRPADRPLWLGSVKSNLGHTQAAAGVAGMIKMVLAMRHGMLPRTLHVDQPSAHVDWSAGAVRLLTRARAWPGNGHPRRAGVSSFGIGGTNAHLILEQAPESREPDEPKTYSGTPCVAVPLSARTPAALSGQAGRLAAFLDARQDISAADAALALATGRAHLERRAVLVVRDRAQLVDELRAVHQGATPAVSGGPAAGRLAFLFTGQGSQWAGMGRTLAAAHPAFAKAFTEVCQAVDQHMHGDAVRPLAEVVFARPGSTDAALIDRTRYTQAGLFALETATCRLLESWGIRPDLVAGHSVGEIAAAHIAGVLGLAEAAELVAARGGLMQALPGGGAMVAVQATEAEVMPLVAASAGGVCVAAVNSATSVVLAGHEPRVLAVAAELAGRGRRTRRLQVSHAFHSARMEPMLAEFRGVADRLSYGVGRTPVVSTLTGRLDADGRLSTADYWVEQARGAVRFGDAVLALREHGVTTFLEVGPGGVLTAMAAEAPGVSAGSCVATLRTSGSELEDMLTAVAELHVRGVPMDWAAVLGRPPSEVAVLTTELPTYAFEHRRYWVDGADGAERTRALDGGTQRTPVPGPVVEPSADGSVAHERLARDPGRALRELILESVGVVLGHRQDDLAMFDDEQSFRSLGFDSLAGVRLSRRLHDLLGVDVPATAVFDHPTPGALAAFLRGQVFGTAPTPAGPGAVAAADPAEPIAIVGMSLRLPGGVDSPQALWDLLVEERDAITGFPVDRGWDLNRLFHPDPAHPGTSYTRSGGFLHDAAQFDAGLFGISPREALAMDPQQRLLLETSWEALERAGINPLSTRGQDIGVFTGIVHHDYVTRLGRTPDEVQGYVMTGTSPSMASGRIAYVFGFAGPAISIDTACSSSLVAVHLAVQALRSGECSMALAGGATVMASPAAFLEFSRQRGLAPDGRCKTFSATADGTGWSEGAGVVVLERLSVARERGHRVLAVIRGSAVNQDGASNGLTAPNGPAQQRVIHQALASAGLQPRDVDAVEAHGTGTVLGDPIEAQALFATYGVGRDPRLPLWLGSLKSNVGHTQAAAGVAGVIKMVEALRRAELPATLHVEEPTPRVDWSPGTVRLLTEARDWPRTGRPRRAAVSAFGASGTNAHLILEAADIGEEAGTVDQPPPRSAVGGSTVPLVLSARTRRSLTAQAARLMAWGTGDAALPATGRTLVTSRAMFHERAVVVAGSGADARAGLAALARGDSAPSLVTGTVARSGGPGRTILVFPGQGAQWVGMGAPLLGTSAVFRARVAECASALAPWVDWSLEDVLRGAADAALLERVDVVQVASFAMMVGLAAVWDSLGVRPDAVLGHSQGEIAAAYVAGALSLPDAARVVAVRGQMIAATMSGHGGMASVRLGEVEARERIAPWGDRLDVAVVNGTSSVVLAGDVEALREAVAVLGAQGVQVRDVPVDYASHTRQVEGIRDALTAALEGISARTPTVPFYSTVTGGWIADGDLLDGAYWYRNLRQQVGFGPAVTDLLGQGYGVFLEVSAHPVLVQPITDLIDEGRSTAAVRPIASGTLRRDDGGLSRVLVAAAHLFVGGLPIDWRAVVPADAGPVADLPTYAFDHQPYWLSETARESEAAPEAEAELWAAIEQADPAALAATLGLRDADTPGLAGVLPALADWRRRWRERSTADRLRYAVTWKPIEREAAGVPGGRWLAVLPECAAVDEVVEALRGQGLDLVTMAMPAARGSAAELADRLAVSLAEQGDLAGVLSLLALDREVGPGLADPTAVTVSSVGLIQALVAAGVTAPLWCLTRGAVNVGIRDHLSAPAQAAVWGLGRVAALEHPNRWGGLVDLPADLDARAAGRLLGVLDGASGEDQVAIRRSGVYVRRLGRATASMPTAGDRWRPRGTVLITGGAEGLGRHTACWLAGAGADRLVVTTSSRTPEGGVAGLRSRLNELGIGVVVESCPDNDSDAIVRLAHADPDHPLTAVVHAADSTQTSPLADTGEADIAEVFDAKVAAALLLGRQFADASLDAFVVFSSIAGIWGGGGQGLSGAANAVLDAAADWLGAAGCPAISISWGALTEAGVGMDETALAQLRRRGLLPMTPAEAMTALEQAGPAEERSVTVAGMDWETFLPAFTSVRPSPLLADLPETKAVSQATLPDDNGETTSELVSSLRAVTEAEQERILQRLVRNRASAVLGHSGAEGIGKTQAFQEAGFDSLAAVNLRDSLIAATGLRLPATLIFDYPNPEALAGFLRAELLRADDEIADREEDLRRVLASVPFDRFRDAGLLAGLLGLAEEIGAGGADLDDSLPTPGEGGFEEADIDALDIESLVQRALGEAR